MLANMRYTEKADGMLVHLSLRSLSPSLSISLHLSLSLSLFLTLFLSFLLARPLPLPLLLPRPLSPVRAGVGTSNHVNCCPRVLRTVFSFAIVCWELVTRKCPFESMNQIQVVGVQA